MTEPGGSLDVVFGATGAIGGAVVGELLRAGRSVRAVSRSGHAPEGAQGAAADASDPAQAARAAVGAAVIYHCASPPYTKWPELFPALTSSILGAAESSGAKLVFADNLYAYGPVDGPLHEDLPAAASSTAWAAASSSAMNATVPPLPCVVAHSSRLTPLLAMASHRPASAPGWLSSSTVKALIWCPSPATRPGTAAQPEPNRWMAPARRR